MVRQGSARARYAGTRFAMNNTFGVCADRSKPACVKVRRRSGSAAPASKQLHRSPSRNGAGSAKSRSGPITSPGFATAWAVRNAQTVTQHADQPEDAASRTWARSALRYLRMPLTRKQRARRLQRQRQARVQERTRPPEQGRRARRERAHPDHRRRHLRQVDGAGGLPSRQRPHPGAAASAAPKGSVFTPRASSTDEPFLRVRTATGRASSPVPT